MNKSQPSNPYFDKAFELEKSGNSKEAFKYFEKAIADPNCPTYLRAEATSKNMSILVDMGEFEKAKIYEARLEKFDLTPRQIGLKYTRQYDLASKLGEYDNAHSFLEKALEHCEVHLPECQDILALALIKKTVFSGGEERKKMLLKAFELLKGYDDQQEKQIFCAGMLCIAFKDSEKEAAKWFNIGKEICQKNTNKYIAWYFRILMWHAYVYLQNNDYNKGIENCLKLEQLYLQDKEEKISRSEIPFIYNYLSEGYRKKGDFFEAILSAQKGLFISQHQKRMATYSSENLAHAYNEIGEYRLAQKYAEQAFKWFKEADPNWNTSKHFSFLTGTYFSLGKAYEHSDKQKSEAYYLKGLEVLDRSHNDHNNPEYLIFWLGLANLNLPKKEIEYAQKALSNHSPQRYFGHIPLGTIYLNLGKIEKAIEEYRTFLNYNLIETDVFDLNNIELKYQFKEYIKAKTVLNKLGTAYFELYKKEQNKVHLDQSLKSFEYGFEITTLLKKDIDPKSQIMVNNQLPNEYAAYIEAMTAQENIDYERILELFETCKGSILHQSMVAKQIQKKYQHLPLVQEEKERQNQLIKLEQAWEQATEVEKKTTLYEQFFNKRKEYQAFLKKLAQKQSDYYREKYEMEDIDLNAIQESLGEDQKVLSYLLTDNQIFILFMDEMDVALQTISKPNDFEQLVKDFFQAINFYEKSVYEETAKNLYQLLIAPVEDLLQDLFDSSTIQDLNIISHGILNQLPFEALFSKKENAQPQYLLSQYDVSYHYSLRLFVQRQQRNRKQVSNSFLGFAPVYNHQESNQWTMLPFSKEEVKGIATLFEKQQSNSQTFLYDDANKETLLKEISQHTFIHIAAHYHQHEIPQQSGLVLSKDEYLFVDDAYTLDLNAILIVLSACESGIGQLSNSEGMMAISRGFLYAGAYNIVSTLYEINDQLASQLMLLFYQNILEGQTIKKALNNAKRTFMQAHPSQEKIWAAFTLIQ